MSDHAAAPVHVVDADPPDVVAPLFEEYLSAHLDEVRQRLGVNLPVAEVLRDDLGRLAEFTPPLGCLLVAQQGRTLLGCVGLRPAEEDGQSFAELKRLYVRPEGRGRGVGRGLVEAALGRARMVNHRLVRLDTFDGIAVARGLYATLGFREIAPYPKDVSELRRRHWTFMEREP